MPQSAPEEEKIYQPGFGEYMMNIQAHHQKLWYAGTQENWTLATYEIGEIHEMVDAVKTYQTERPESKLIPMIEPALDTVQAAINAKSETRFTHAYVNLTNTCNTCHHEANHPFIHILVPESGNFPDQDFKPLHP